MEKMKIIANDRAVGFLNALCDIYLKTVGIKGHQDVQEMLEGLERFPDDSTIPSQDKASDSKKIE